MQVKTRDETSGIEVGDAQFGDVVFRHGTRYIVMRRIQHVTGTVGAVELTTGQEVALACDQLVYVLSGHFQET